MTKLGRLLGFGSPDMSADKRKHLTDLSSKAPRERFFQAAKQLGPASKVLEVGTKQSIEGRGTNCQARLRNILRRNYVMADVMDGIDVDVVADLHALPDEWADRFNAFIAIAVFEHLERPWIAAKEVARILAPKGICYVSTHQTFPIHGYPSDFFRYSKEALSLIFEDAGLRIVEVAYEHRAEIIPPTLIVPSQHIDQWNAAWPSYIVVHLMAEKA